MDNEENKLKATFNRMMDEEFKNIPSFDEMSKDLDKKENTEHSRGLVLFIKPFLKYAAVLVPIGMLTYFMFFNEKKTDITNSITHWEMSSNELLPDHKATVTVSSWQSPTDFLLNTKMTNNEK
ncbi:MAG: hypothetical protein HKN68_11315 [Saprospiraceae bacterium]|nr:hypothetical protein [Saprospiraceae bacterium]